MSNGVAASLQEGQTFVKVSPLVAGTITLPDRIFIKPLDDPTSKRTVPCMAFLVEHPKKKFMFDLGLRAAPEKYIPEIQSHLPNRQPVTHRPSAPEILKANNIDPTTLSAVILSHVHWDHHGDPVEFPSARFFVGHESLDVLAHGLRGRGSHSHFDPDLFQHNSHTEFAEPQIGQSIYTRSDRDAALSSLHGADQDHAPVWEALGPFPFAADLYGDKSIYLVPAPGHLPGHVNLLCRVSADKWIYLGGDAYHDIRLVTGEKQIATWEEDGTTCCVHVDQKEAMASIGKISSLRETLAEAGLELEAIAAHDSSWYEKNKERCLVV